MKRYEIKITEVLTKTISIEVEDNETLIDAIEMVKDQYYEEGIVLTADDCDSSATTFEPAYSYGEPW